MRLVCDFDLAKVIWESFFVTLLPEELLYEKKKWQLEKHMYMNGPMSIGDALFETSLDSALDHSSAAAVQVRRLWWCVCYV